MKAIRWVVGFVGVFVFVFVVDLVFYNYVFDTMLTGQGGLVRSPETLRRLLPLMFAAQFLFALLFTYYFFRLYKDAKFLVLRGLFYGFWMGAVFFGLRAVWEFYLFAVERKLVLSILALGWVECLFAGIFLGVVGWGLPQLLGRVQVQPAAPPPAPPPVPPPPPPAP